MCKTRVGILVAVVGIVFAFATGAQALMMKSGESVFIPKDETVSGSLYAAASDLTVDGTVEGDVVCAGESVTINGTVEGDVLCAGETVIVNGTVGGNVRSAGNSVIVNGKVARSVMVFSSSLSIGSEAEINKDLLFGAAMANLYGNIKRDIDGVSANVLIGGTVGRNVWLMLDDQSGRKDRDSDQEAESALTLTKGSSIGGNLDYTAGGDMVAEGDATVKGSVNRHDPIISERHKVNAASAIIWWIIVTIFSALLTGLLLATWLRKPLHDIGQRINASPFKALGYGALVMIVAPIACIILAVTIIGLPLALIMLALWMILLYIGDIITAIVLGQAINTWYVKKYPAKKPIPYLWAAVIGIVIAALVFSIPVIGWILSFAATLIGVGAVWMYGRDKSCVKQI